MEAQFSDVFVKSLKKHSSVKKAIQKKVDMIIVKRNFLIIYLYCRVCRAKGDDKTIHCHDCLKCKDETVKFVDMGPHDEAYRKKSYWP
ncbi:MAG: hypothetical protein HY759_04040 [Nitrospirae bacterium]|nr:hypothetical protein [Nitrospirota bacterium]